MNTLIKHIFVNGWETSARGEASDSSGHGKLIVNVIFTDAKGTLAALRSARSLAHDLGAHIRVLATHAVPFAYSLDKPPVAVAFTEKLLVDLVSQEAQSQSKRLFIYTCAGTDWTRSDRCWSRIPWLSSGANAGGRMTPAGLRACFGLSAMK